MQFAISMPVSKRFVDALTNKGRTFGPPKISKTTRELIIFTQEVLFLVKISTFSYTKCINKLISEI